MRRAGDMTNPLHFPDMWCQPSVSVCTGAVVVTRFGGVGNPRQSALHGEVCCGLT